MTIELIRSRLWEVLQTVDSKAIDWHLDHYLALDPACSDRQAVVANARVWVVSEEGQITIAGFEAARSNRQRERNALQMRRDISATRSAQLTSRGDS